MAVRLDNIGLSHAAVVVVDSRGPASTFGERDELQCIDLLRSDLKTLSRILLEREAALTQHILRIYTSLGAAWAAASDAPPLDWPSVFSVCRVTGEPRLRAHQVFFRITTRRAQRWFPSPTPVQRDALASLLSLAARRPFSLSRSHYGTAIHHALTKSFGDEFVWCATSVKVGNTSIDCAASHVSAHSVLDHWTYSDLLFLENASFLLEASLEHARHATRLIKQLDAGGKSTRERDFAFLAYILQHFFGIDQILLASVRKTAEWYEIIATDTHGFGRFNERIKERPKRYIHGDALGPRPDIMVRILHDYLTHNKPSVYEGRINAVHETFALDNTLNDMCGLRGSLYFVPCVTDSEASSDALLGVLHLGSRDGSLYIPQESFRVLRVLGRKVAEWLRSEEIQRARMTIGKIQQCYPNDLKELCSLCDEVANACSAVACTVFLKAAYLPLVKPSTWTRKRLIDACISFCNMSGQWRDIFTSAQCDRLRLMLSVLGGVDIHSVDLLLATESRDLGRLLANNLYIKTASHTAEADLDLVYETLSATSLPKLEETKRMGTIILTMGYVSGWGLTGWVARYSKLLVLKDKRGQTIRDTLPETERRTPFSRAVDETIRLLKRASYESSLSPTRAPLPEHADHVSDATVATRSLGAFLACPIEGVNNPDDVIGVVRVSNIGTLRSHFRPEDVDVVDAAARTISHALKRSNAAARAIVDSAIGGASNELDWMHRVRRGYDATIAIDEILQRIEAVDPAANADRKNIRIHSDRLQAFCDDAINEPDRAAIITYVASRKSPWTLREFISLLKQWLGPQTTARIKTFIVQEDEQTILPPIQIVWWCNVVTELLRNQRRYDYIEDPTIIVSPIAGLSITIGNVEAADLSAMTVDWLNYEWVRQEDLAGGAVLIRRAQTEAQIKVQYIRETASRDKLLIAVKAQLIVEDQA